MNIIIIMVYFWEKTPRYPMILCCSSTLSLRPGFSNSWCNLMLGEIIINNTVVDLLHLYVIGTVSPLWLWVWKYLRWALSCKYSENIRHAELTEVENFKSRTWDVSRTVFLLLCFCFCLSTAWRRRTVTEVCFQVVLVFPVKDLTEVFASVRRLLRVLVVVVAPTVRPVRPKVAVPEVSWKHTTVD